MVTQGETSHFNCTNKNLQKNEINSTIVDRMIVSTYGSFIADSLSEWSEQVLKFTTTEGSFGDSVHFLIVS